MKTILFTGKNAGELATICQVKTLAGVHIEPNAAETETAEPVKVFTGVSWQTVIPGRFITKGLKYVNGIDITADEPETPATEEEISALSNEAGTPDSITPAEEIVVTEQHLEQNPDLAAEGVTVGETIQVPAEAVFTPATEAAPTDAPTPQDAPASETV